MISNGDVWDIGQTVNGCSMFLYFNDKWYYANRLELFEYNYHGGELTNLIIEDYDDETKLIGNVFTDDIGLEFSLYPEVLQAIREYKLNKIL